MSQFIVHLLNLHLGNIHLVMIYQVYMATLCFIYIVALLWPVKKPNGFLSFFGRTRFFKNPTGFRLDTNAINLLGFFMDSYTLRLQCVHVRCIGHHASERHRACFVGWCVVSMCAVQTLPNERIPHEESRGTNKTGGKRTVAAGSSSRVALAARTPVP